jgi:hypothetical protein
LNFLFFFKKKAIFEVLKKCVLTWISSTQKNYFLAFWILQHVCKTPKGVGQYSKKYKNLIFGGIHLLSTVNVWIKKSQRDEYTKYYLE